MLLKVVDTEAWTFINPLEIFHGLGFRGVGFAGWKFTQGSDISLVM